MNNEEGTGASAYRSAALSRLKDAVILYEGQRFLGAVYMAGYVVEIGARSEFCLLREVKLDEKDYLRKVLAYLYKDMELPKTLSELLDKIKDVETRKASAHSTFKAISESRIISESGSKFHNIQMNLETLRDWKIALGFEGFNIEDYRVDQIFGWDTKLRYEQKITHTYNDETAKAAILLSINFLKNVVFKEDSPEFQEVISFENRIDPSNQDRTLINIENKR